MEVAEINTRFSMDFLTKAVHGTCFAWHLSCCFIRKLETTLLAAVFLRHAASSVRHIPMSLELIIVWYCAGLVDTIYKQCDLVILLDTEVRKHHKDPCRELYAPSSALCWFILNMVKAVSKSMTHMLLEITSTSVCLHRVNM